MSQFSYLWYQYRLHVDCEKCGNGIVFQHLDGYPQCLDCGHVNGHTWHEALQFCDVGELIRGETGNKHLMGLMTAASSSEAVSSIDCLHCKKSTMPTVDILSGQNYACENCGQAIVFMPLAFEKDMVLYRKTMPENKVPATSMIAVRCASCGAPLEVDPSKTNYPCRFCKVENILPPALRHEKTYDDVFIGVRKKIWDMDALLQSNDPNAVMTALRSAPANSFKGSDLNAVMMRFAESAAIFNLLRHKTGHAFPNTVYERIWEVSRIPEVIGQAGQHLGKSAMEISARQNSVAKKPSQKTENAKIGLLGRIRSLIGF